MKNKQKHTKDVSLVLCGAAGLGIQTVEELLIKILQRSGYYVFGTKEYMSRVRGGLNSTEIRVASKEVRAFVDRIDLFFVFSKGAIERHNYRITDSTVIIGDSENIDVENKEDYNIVEVPLKEEAKNLGNKVYANSIAAGIIAGLFNIELSLLEDFFKERFEEKGEEIIENNKKAAEIGMDLARELEETEQLVVDIPKSSDLEKCLLLSGNEAVSIGALAGGCNFLYAYPMSPSTGVLTFFAQHQKEFDIIVDQGEDEIACINAAIGAWYVGGRGLASTSGGGFSLMTEGLSLAGVTESPLVVHLAQRPGPATGLPTRTAQEDFTHALYASHGEFPRIIIAPKSVEDAFYLTQNAFNLADKFQVPVIILTDHYLINTYYSQSEISVKDIAIDRHITETNEEYERYAFTNSGISPRGIPGGKGLVCVDSHEHDTKGHITEDLHKMRKKQMSKRLKKYEAIKEEIILPELIGPKDYKYLIVSWGSPYFIIKEAVEKTEKDNIAILHFNWLHPLAEQSKDILEKAEQIIVIENNDTAQFGHYLKNQFCVDFQHTILKNIGLPFSVEELTKKLVAIMEEK